MVDLTIARTSIRNTSPLPLGDSDKIEVGEDIVVLGDQPGAGKTISLGVVKGVVKAKGVQLIEITASIRPGRSGAPVLSSAGKVIGIATAFLDYGRKNNFAMPVNYLKSLQPTRLKLRSLPKRVASFDAVLRDETFVELVESGSHKPAGQKNERPDGRNLFAPGTVYFKSGKRLVCERAWKDGNKIYLLVNGKEIAVSYDETEIEMKKSFDLSTGDGGKVVR
jgi:S1-C subfamily serine protease